MKTLNHSLNILTTTGIFDISQSNDFASIFPSSTQSLNATSASPILAVTSRISKLKAERIFDTTCIANLKPPPRIVVIILRIANIPLNVRCIFFPVSLSSPVSLSVSLSFSEKSFTDLAIPYNFIASSPTPGGLNISTQAFFIALPIPIKPSAAFLNDSMKSVLPSFSDISLARSPTETPSILASFSSALYREISSLVSPACSNCSSVSLPNSSVVFLVSSAVVSIVRPNFL